MKALSRNVFQKKTVFEQVLFLLIVIGYLTTSFTKLRLYSIGFSELVFSVAFILFFTRAFLVGFGQSNLLINYFALLMLCMMVGTIYNYLFINYFPINLVVYNIFALVFNWLILFIIGRGLNLTLINKIFSMVLLLAPVLIVTCLSGDDFFFWEKGNFRYEFLSSNPNQLALFILMFPCFLMRNFKLAGKNLLILKAIGLVFLFYIGVRVRSQALFVAWALVFIFLIAYLFNYCLSGIWAKRVINKKLVLILFLLVLGLSVFSYEADFNYLYRLIMGCWQTESQVRFDLWSLAFKNILNSSPLFGMGFGSFINLSAKDFSGIMEAHNTFVDVFIQSGIIGLSVYGALLYKIFKRVWQSKDLYLIAGFIALITFSFFHYVLRQPIFWFYLYWLSIASKESFKMVSETNNNTLGDNK